MKLIESMQTTFRILIILSLLIIFQSSVHSQRKGPNKKKTTVEVFAGLSMVNSTNVYNIWRDELAYGYTLKYRFGTKLYTSLGKRLNLGFGLNFFNTGFGYDSVIGIPKKTTDYYGNEFTFISTEVSKFNRSYWYIGIPVALNVQINKPSRKNKFSTYFEVGFTPSFFQFIRERNIHPEKEETNFDGKNRPYDNLILVNSSILIEYKLSEKLLLILRPSFQIDLFDRARNSKYAEPHHDFNIEAGVRTRLYKWWR